MLFEQTYTNEDASKTIENFLNDRLIPQVNALESLAVAVQRLKIGTFGVFHRKQLAALEQDFREKSKQFLTLNHIYSDPDKLFADLKLDPQKDAERIKDLQADYENSKTLVNYHMKRGFRMLELLQRQLDRYHRSADQRLAVFLSILAITASVISVGVSFAY